MYLIDTNVISEARKGGRANAGVQRFFEQAHSQQWPLFLSVITVGELRRGVGLIRYRGDITQAAHLDQWLTSLLDAYANSILDIDPEIAEIWAYLRVPHYGNALDKLIAATALIHGLTVVTRNTQDFASPRVEVFNPFGGDWLA